MNLPTPGKYTASVIRHTYGTSPQKGTPKFDIYFEIEGPEQGGPWDGNFECWLTDASMGMARKSLKAIGYDPDTMDLDMLANEPMKLMGQKAIVTVGEEQWNDEWRRKIMFVDPLSAAPKPGQLAALSKALKDVKGSSKKKTTTTTPKPSSPVGPPRTEAEKTNEIRNLGKPMEISDNEPLPF